MCLINAERIYPEEDIVVYKFIVREPDPMKKWRYRSPFYEQYWEPEERMDSNGPAEKDLVYGKKDTSPNLVINGNAFHAYACISDARRYAKEWAWYSDVETAVGEFVIPKDSAEVYVGCNSYCLKTIGCYASTSMIFKRPVMDWEEVQIY